MRPLFDIVRLSLSPCDCCADEIDAYMELMKNVENNHRLEHTLDIEVAWKCHRLNHIQYCKDVAGFADQDYFASCTYGWERWSTTGNHGHGYEKETQRVWEKRFKGQRF
jgi:hypothetical protein